MNLYGKLKAHPLTCRKLIFFIHEVQCLSYSNIKINLKRKKWLFLVVASILQLHSSFQYSFLASLSFFLLLLLFIAKFSDFCILWLKKKRWKIKMSPLMKFELAASLTLQMPFHGDLTAITFQIKWHDILTVFLQAILFVFT